MDVTWHLATHDLSIALEILGSVPEVRSATGEMRSDNHIWRCDATLEAQIGATHHLLAAAGETVKQRAVRLVGSERSASLADGYDHHIVLVDRAGTETIQKLSSELPLERELRTVRGVRAGWAAAEVIGCGRARRV